MSYMKFASLVLLIALFAGCSKKKEQPPADQAQTTVQQPSVQQTPTQAQPTPSEPEAIESEKAPIPRKARVTRTPRREQDAPNKEVAGGAERATPPVPEAAPAVAPAVEQTPPPAAPQPRFARVPAGTGISARLQETLDSGVNQTGDSFRAILDEDLIVDGEVAAPRGSLLEGKLSQVTRSGRVQGRASMSMELLNLIVNGRSYPLQTEILSIEAKSSMKKDAAKVGLGAGLGAVIGAIAGGGKGAAIGAAVGAGAGGATVAATRGEELRLESERSLTFELQNDVRVKLR